MPFLMTPPAGPTEAELSMQMLKRVRSPSMTTTERPLAALKICKRELHGSPMAYKQATREMEVVPWPQVKGCEGLRNAMLLLNNSRQRAILLMLQDEWERAMQVLEKIEKATESVSNQRRKLVLEQANHIRDMLVSENLPSQRPQRTVRFCDDVQVLPVEEMDRSSWQVESPVREEMLVLRASRAIPNENYSELWQ